MEEKRTSSVKYVFILAFVLFGAFRLYHKVQKITEPKHTPIAIPQNFVPNKALEKYASPANSEFPNEATRIFEVWAKLNNNKIDALDKIDLVSSSFVKEFKSQLSDALIADSDDMQELGILEKFKVYKTRKALLDLFTLEELKSRADIAAIFLDVNLSNIAFPALTKIKFESEHLAYAVFPIMNNFKSVQFQKENGMWKANVLTEDPEFYDTRYSMLIHKISEAGGTKAYYNTIFSNEQRIYEALAK